MSCCSKLSCKRQSVGNIVSVDPALVANDDEVVKVCQVIKEGCQMPGKRKY